MKKIIFSILFSVVLFTSTAFAEPYRVFDTADILTDEEEAQIEAMIRDFQMAVAMDFAVLTTNDDHDPEQNQQITDAFYDGNGFGMGRDNSGCAFYIDMHNRQTYISTTGEMIDCMTDKRLGIALDISSPALTDGKYALGIALLMTVVKAFAYDGPPSGQFRYEAR